MEWLWPERVQFPVHHWEALWIATEAPQSETLWDLGVAKSDCHILSSIRGKTSKSPQGLEKCQQNCKIKATFMNAQSSGSWTVQKALCCTESTRLEAKVEVRMLALHSKKRGTQPWLRRGKYSYPVPQSIILSFYPQCIAKWIKDTLRSSKNSFCTPLSSCSTGIVGNVTHHRVSNALKGSSEKKYPLSGFTHPLTRQLRKQRHGRPGWIKRINL